MTPYATAIEAWAGVYEVAALASAALAGLLFVTVSLHVDLLAGERAAGIRTMARQTLTNFIVIVVISLIFQIPEATPLSTGVPLVAVGVVGCFEEIRLGLRVRQLSRQELTLIPQNFITMRLLVPSASYGVVVAVALALLLGQPGALYWNFVAVVAILLSAVLNSWDMLIHLSASRARAAAESASADVGETTDFATAASSQIGPKIVDPENADVSAEPAAGDPSADSC